MLSTSNKKLTIGLVLDTTLDTQDGVPQYVIGVGEWLRSRGHVVDYIVGETTRTDISGVISIAKNITVTFNGNKISSPLPVSSKTVKRVLAEKHYDILHVQAPYSPFMAHKIIRKASSSTAIIGTFHILPTGLVASWGTKILSVLVSSSRLKFQQFFSVTSAAQEFAKKQFGIGSIVVPNVFDYQLFNSAKPLDRYKSSAPIILFFGRLVPRKGALQFLQAVRALHSQHPELAFRAVIGGAGALRESLELYVQQNNMQNIVTFEGFVSVAEKPRLYASSRVTVFPSLGGESFGIVLLEAMASGKAVVLAGNNPGYASVMQPQPELLFNPHNTQALADKMYHYLVTDNDHKSMSDWGKSYTEAFDVSVVGQKIEAEYYNALRKVQ